MRSIIPNETNKLGNHDTPFHDLFCHSLVKIGENSIDNGTRIRLCVCFVLCFVIFEHDGFSAFSSRLFFRCFLNWIRIQRQFRNINLICISFTGHGSLDRNVTIDLFLVYFDRDESLIMRTSLSSSSVESVISMTAFELISIPSKPKSIDCANFRSTIQVKFKTEIEIS